MKVYGYTLTGTAADGQTWKTEGIVDAGGVAEALAGATRDSFLQLTLGRAEYGKPGVGCHGPYEIDNVILSRVDITPDAET